MNGILGSSTVKTKRRVDGISDFVRFATTQLTTPYINNSESGCLCNHSNVNKCEKRLILMYITEAVDCVSSGRRMPIGEKTHWLTIVPTLHAKKKLTQKC